MGKPLYIYKCKNEKCKNTIYFQNKLDKYQTKKQVCGFCGNRGLITIRGKRGSETKTSRGKPINYTEYHGAWIRDSRIYNEDPDFYVMASNYLISQNLNEVEVIQQKWRTELDFFKSDLMILLSRFYENDWLLDKGKIKEKHRLTKKVIFEIIENNPDLFSQNLDFIALDINEFKKILSEKDSIGYRKKEKRKRIRNQKGNEIYSEKEIEKAKEKIEKGGYHAPDSSSNRQSRIGQAALRKITLDNYNYKCALCKIDMLSFLVTSHIIPWRDDKNNRLNPRNVLCLCVFHDKAFENGLITIEEKNEHQLFVIIQNKRIRSKHIKKELQRVTNRVFKEPDKYPPERSFLEYHRIKFSD